MDQRSTMAQIDGARSLMTSVLAPAVAAGLTPEPVARPVPAVPAKNSVETLRIQPEHFADSLKLRPMACIPFDIAVASAGNHGLMIADAAPKSPVVKSVINIAEITTGRRAAHRASKFDDLLNRFWKRH